ncbi:hypothetical protein GCM10009836_25750 [Pseudonocardia ailaonensis]|uniref:Uncharacterized protein n=1 Tax=Pseudonocardia ailaonensis TaxID=367279 RepID=A0ABN2MYY1_9PSEU
MKVCAGAEYSTVTFVRSLSGLGFGVLGPEPTDAGPPPWATVFVEPPDPPDPHAERAISAIAVTATPSCRPRLH